VTTTPPGGPTGFARLHTDALERLTAWAPPDDRQAGLRDEFVAHLRAHPDAMSKQGPPAHLTGSVLVLDPTGEHALLTLHRRARRWFQLGGHYEAGDATVLAAATREAREESGLPHVTPLPQVAQLDRHVLAGDFGTCREHLDVRFVAVAGPGAQAVVSDESLDLRWWPVDALPEDSRDELAPLVAAGRRLLAGAATAPSSVVADGQA
jgi:8-oxo-dGTP pyrophosphatase MutT (NUDIX family)